MVSMLMLGKIRPLPRHKISGSMKREIVFILECLHPPRSPTREAVCRSSSKYQARRLPEIHPDYSTTASGCSVSSGTPKRGTTSRLTGAGSLLPPLYSEAWAKGNADLSLGHQSPPNGRSVGKGNAKDPQNTIVLLTGCRIRQTCGSENQRC
ncbi:hypothetical protein TNCV_1683031 [Trichonephila clavipes]|nr:hypothetical protein TNCV_1683031 [Trichonephila clavipes]